MLEYFNSYGTEKVAIGFNPKCGSSSVGSLHPTHKEINNFTKFDDNQIYVVIIRDVLERWSSGQKQEIISELKTECPQVDSTWLDLVKIPTFRKKPDNDKWIWPFGDNVEENFLKYPEYIYNVFSRVSKWYHQAHSDIFSWNHASHKCSFGLLMSKPNIYFLDLKDLSNPKFLKWLQKIDSRWNEVKEIGHDNKTGLFWENIVLFWKEFKEGVILKDKPKLNLEVLSINDEDSDYIHQGPEVYVPHGPLAKFYTDTQQSIIEYIRNQHERYIRL
tara:strand:- start:2940 stop:3761 length:822 start_codon:yes stop_codon:yes gene_type:complete